MVDWFMNETPQGVPAQRVINSKGELSGSWVFGSTELMRQLLENEGIVFAEDGRVALKRYGWDPARDLSEEELRDIVDNAGNDYYLASVYHLGSLHDDSVS